METNKKYFCFGSDRDISGISGKFSLIQITLSSDKSREIGFEVLKDLTPREIYERKITVENLKVSCRGGKYSAEFLGSASRYPSIYCGDSGIHLSIKAFASRFQRLNPMRVWPSKPELMRTVTVLGETCRKTDRYINYWMSNRKMKILDKNYIVRKYFVCDYNGSVAYLSFEQLQSVANRYGFTNAKISGSRIVRDDGAELLQLPEALSEKINPAESYVCGESTDDFEQKTVRFYADTFFSFRRQKMSFTQGSDEEAEAIAEFRESIEAFHQCLLFNTVPKTVYQHIRSAVDNIFPENSKENIYFPKIKRELQSQIQCLYFRPTPAFEDMLSMRKTAVKKVISLQTLAELAPDISEHYCAVMLAETEISRLMTDCGNKFGYKLIGLEYRLKSPDSLYEKLYERPNDMGKSLEKIFGETRDILRYTVCFDDSDRYCGGITELLETIMKKYNGQLECFRNYWTPYVEGDYKGINVVVKIPDVYWDMQENRLRGEEWSDSRYCVKIPSFCFEVQFHTSSSFEAKQQNHLLYEINRRADTTPEERAKNSSAMAENIKSVVTPKNAEFFDMTSNEYIIALKDCISMMKAEIAQICSDKEATRYIDVQLTVDS